MIGDEEIEKLEEYLVRERIFYKKDVLLKNRTYLKAGGVVKIFIQPGSADEIVGFVRFSIDNNIEFMVVGGTSNVYFLDELTYGVVLSTSQLDYVGVNEDVISVEAGYLTQDFVRLCLVNGAAGFEGLEGVPGTIGGAIFMNAGAYGYSISDNLIEVVAINEHGSVITLSKEDCKYSYRSSLFRMQEGLIVLQARFRLVKGDKKKSAERIRNFHIARHSYQEFAFPNIGSLFSVGGDVYREISKNDFFSKWICFLLKLILKNPFSKFMSRKNPNNKLFNDFVRLMFPGRKYEIDVSDKTINILMNTGDASYEDVARHINTLGEYLKEWPIENEVVERSLYDSEDNVRFVLGMTKIKGMNCHK
jgi:UDP-N-acetylmuramate dehydrogenase